MGRLLHAGQFSELVIDLGVVEDAAEVLCADALGIEVDHLGTVSFYRFIPPPETMAGKEWVKPLGRNRRKGKEETRFVSFLCFVKICAILYLPLHSGPFLWMGGDFLGDVNYLFTVRRSKHSRLLCLQVA